MVKNEDGMSAGIAQPGVKTLISTPNPTKKTLPKAK